MGGSEHGVSTMAEIMDRLADEVTERRSTCPTHGDFTSRRYTLYAGGREHWTRCEACEIDRKREEGDREARQKAEDEQRALEQRLDRAGIPQRFRSRTLDGFVAETPEQKRAHSIAKAFAEGFEQRYDDGANLIFSGPPGTGKSHLALGIAQAIMPRWHSVYITAREMVMRLRATWRDDSPMSEIDLQHVFTGTHLLIIDEVGVQFGTEAERTQIFGVIDDRYRNQLPTILLTNLDIDGFKAFIGARAYDRLRESGTWVPFDWDSYRGRKA